jgi:hypothetical protein
MPVRDAMFGDTFSVVVGRSQSAAYSLDGQWAKVIPTELT